MPNPDIQNADTNSDTPVSDIPATDIAATDVPATDIAATDIPAMASSLHRSVLVTGGSRGIGRAIASRFAASGHRVAATYGSGEVPAGVLGVRCDVTDPDQVDAAFTEAEQAHGPVQVLVANAGITNDGLLFRMSDEDWSRVLETNLTGSFRLARRAARGMTRGRFGRMIFISSVVAQLGSAGQVNYAAAKAGLLGLARSLARELGNRQVTANVVAPGFIETDMTAQLTPEQIRAHRARTPAGRLGSVDDVAAVVEFLAGQGAGYINGALIPVDGGLGMGH